MSETNQEGGGRRSFLFKVAAVLPSLSLLSLLSTTQQGCSSGGSSGGGGAPPSGGNPPPATQVAVGATTRKEGGVQVNSSFQSLYVDDLYTEVGPSGAKVSGGLNFAPWEPAGADSTQVDVGDSVTWSVAGTGTGGPWTFMAT